MPAITALEIYEGTRSRVHNDASAHDLPNCARTGRELDVPAKVAQSCRGYERTRQLPDVVVSVLAREP